MTAPRGTVYILALIDPNTGEHVRPDGELVKLSGHAPHYTGFSANGHFDRRMVDQLAGNAHSAKLVQAGLRAGYGWKLVGIYRDKPRGFERYLKNQHNAARYCLDCRARYVGRKTKRTGRRRVPLPQRPPRLLLTPPPRPELLEAFLQLNPTFARPVRASAVAQFAGARNREECEALSPRVVRARVDENLQLQQKRVAAVIRVAVRARRAARRKQAAERAERERLRRLAVAHTASRRALLPAAHPEVV